MAMGKESAAFFYFNSDEFGDPDLGLFLYGSVHRAHLPPARESESYGGATSTGRMTIVFNCSDIQHSPHFRLRSGLR